MLGKKIVMKDIEILDEEFYNSLNWLKYGLGCAAFGVAWNVAYSGHTTCSV